ncbi:tetratricopeptide repeat protein [Actinoplanes sp. GCM10030250]|uniref:tetratricopeptide repeat protein n=1 Tax=Actinoplanes sp. GCM10030250 TaxID=3273376 RepID=UPI00362306AA
MDGPRWRHALELAAELDHGTDVSPPELDHLLGVLLSEYEAPEVTELLCLADLLDEAGLTSQAGSVLAFGRRSYPASADQVRVAITAAQHAVNHGDHHRAVTLLGGVRGLSPSVDVSLASVALAMGDNVLAQHSLAAVSRSSRPLAPNVEAALAGARAQLSATPDAAESVWRGALAGDRDGVDPTDPQLLILLAGHARIRFDAAGVNGDRRTQQEALGVLETVAMLASSALGAGHPDALRAQVNGDLVGFDYACASYREQEVAAAWERLRASAEVQLASFGPLHPETVATQISVAAAQFETARFQRDLAAAGETLAHLDHVRADAEMVLGPRHISTIAAAANYATARLELLYVQGRAMRDAAAVSRAADDLSELEQRADEVLGEAHPTAVVLRQMTRVARAMADPGAMNSEPSAGVALRLRTLTLSDFADPSPFGVNAYESVDRAASRVSTGSAIGRRNPEGGISERWRAAETVTAFEQVFLDRRRLLGYDHPETLTSRNNLAYAYQTAGRVDEAIKWYEQVFHARRRVLGADHPDTLSSHNNLAGAYEMSGRVAKAISLHEQVLLDRRRVLGDDHPQTLTSRNNLAYAYQTAGRVAEATALYEQVLEHQRRELRDDHPDTMAIRNNLAYAYQTAGRVAEATALYSQVLTDQRRVLGDDHPDTLVSRNNLAYAYQAAGRVGEAIALYKVVLIAERWLLGDDDPQTLASRNNLAYAYQTVGRLAEAVALFEQVLIDQRRVLGDNHPQTLTTRNNLAGAYARSGREAEAITVYELVLLDRRRVLGDDHPQTRSTQSLLEDQLKENRGGGTG